MLQRTPNVARRTPKLDHPNGNAKDDAVKQWLPEKMGKLEISVRFAFRALQFLPSPFNIEDHACNGGGHH
jgi:hypothetical protein